MGRFLLEKLIVISDIEEKSKEISFGAGLNIVLGKNKTGKSSLLKSIFYTLGSELKFESEWRKVIRWYILYFSYDGQTYCVIREGKKFKIIKVHEKYGQKLLIDTEQFHDYSDTLMKILGVDVQCLTNVGKSVSITPPLLFRFQYIDQDRGWNKIGEASSNMGYILNWRDYTNKYVVGFQGTEFYKTKKEISLLKQKIDELCTKVEHYKEVMEYLIPISEEDESKTIVTELEKAKSILEQLSRLEKQRLKVQDEISILKNERYEKILALDLLKKNVQELNEDHEFALNEDNNLKCPFCGVYHNNTMTERVEIVKDIQSGSELIGLYRKDISELDKYIGVLNENFNKVNQEYFLQKKRVEALEEGASIVNSYKIEGKQEVIRSSKLEIKRLENLIKEEEGKKVNKEDYLNSLNSNERRKQIYSDLKRVYIDVMEKLNIPISYIKFKNFVQVLDKTGSELPRIIYAYQIALYLFNLEREEGLFNWLVVDTPNQQGQDENNLDNIDSVLELVLTKKGQFIIGTERETGFEDRAENVIKLTEFKKCLTPDKFVEHKALIDELSKF